LLRDFFVAIDLDVLIAGAGCVGLAIGRAFARKGLSVAVVEAQESFGLGVSQRSSEVIHAGLYYPQGSLKARFCVAGRRLLYAYCAARAIAHRRTTKLVVAAEESEEGGLDGILERARQNGVEDVHRLSGAEARAREPALRCSAALDVQVTGIIDSHSYMQSLVAEIEELGGAIAYMSRITRIVPESGGLATTILGPDGEDGIIRTRFVVNAAGLGAQAIAGVTEGLAPARIPKLHLSRGCYYVLSGRAPVSRLIYPLPTREGLGVHLTLDMGGQARFGPDHAWIQAIDYTMPDHVPAEIIRAVQHYLPGIPPEKLAPAYAGIRPKIQGPGDPPADFVIEGPAAHGIPGLVNLFGIESPGLTSSLAIGDFVTSLLGHD
jgi:L-2-hydroxyglutarate oxidase LhgO